MSEPTTAAELYDSIVASRGGIEALTPEQVRVCHALTSALARKPSDIDPGLVERLASMLPTPVKKAGPTSLTVEFIDPRLERLSDSELDMLEAIVGKMTGEAPAEAVPPSPEAVALTALREENERLREREKWLEAQWSQAARAADAVKREVAAAKSVLPAPVNAPAVVEPEPAPAAAPAPAPFSDPRGDGSCAISAPLHERYPLSDLDPVGRW